MAQESRRPFTVEDKDHLAQFLVGIPSDKREAPSTHKEMERRHPEHSYQAWLNHYKKVDKEGIERRIERIRRQRKRDKEAARSTKGKGKERARNDDDDDEHDQLAEDDDVQVVKTSSSTSRPTADNAAAPSTKKNKKRKALELPRPSSSSSDDSDAPTRPVRSTGRKKYADEDFKLLVRFLYRAEQESWLKQRIYAELEAFDPDHSAGSWQTYHRDHRADLDESLRDYRELKKGVKKSKKDKKREKREKRKQREATTESAASSTLPPPRKKQKQVPVELSDDDDDRAPGPSASVQRPAIPVASSSKAAQPAASTSSSATAATVASTSTAPTRAPRASLPALSTTSAPAKAPRPSLPAPSTAPLAPSSTASKGKQRAVEPDELPAASGSGDAGARVEHAVEGEGEGEGDPDEAAPFGEQDTAELVHQLARAELKGWGKDTVWEYMAKKLGRSPDDWRAYYVANVVDLLIKVAHKVGELLAAQEHKRKAAAAAAAQQEKEEAERLERERAEEAAAAADAERVRLEKEREEAQRRAREAEEQREREEQARLDAEEEARKQAAAEAEEAEREERDRVERVEADKVRAEKTRQARQERARVRRKEAPSTSPPPFSSQEARPVAVKPASTVLTPRSTPPFRPTATAPLFLPTSPTTRASIEAMYGPDLDAIDEGDALAAPDASGNSLPHLSQYSVAPSPFLDAHLLACAHENGVHDVELGSGADTDDRELDQQLSAAVATTVKAERDDDDDALELQQHVLDDDDDDDAPIWDPLLDVEYNLIIDSHELVEALSARSAAAAAAQLDAPSVVTMTEATTPGSKKRRRSESPARATTNELEAHEQEQPAVKRQRIDAQQPAAPRRAAQPAQAPEPVAAAVSPAPPLRSSPSASRRVPRASLAAVASASPAPPPPPATAMPAPISASTAVAATAPAPTPTPTATSTARRPLKDELTAVSAASGLSYTAVRDLYFCVSALSDLSILRDVALFFSSTRRPEEGTAEWERARRRVDKYVWSAREDEVVLEGTGEARARVDERKGAGSVERRREFLRRAKMTKIADLRASLYSRKA
ncbi:hypothetical protein JCM8208_001810 [Rhodotorula glutinis]